jgi:hypothetical protein
VDFGALRATAPNVKGAVSTGATPQPGTSRASGTLHKGLMMQDVDALLGSPAKMTNRKEGTLDVQSREYTTSDGRVTADFVEGVLVRYTMTSE